MQVHRRFASLTALMLIVSAFVVPSSFAQPAQPFTPKIVLNSSPRTPDTSRRFVPGQLIVKMRATSRTLSASDATQAVRAKFSVATGARLIAPQTFRLDVAQDADVVALAADIASNPDVEYAQPNYLRYMLRSVNDPLSTFQYGNQKVNAVAAWDITTGSSGVTIAVIDTGLALGHPEFAGRIAQGYDFADNDSNPSDVDGHGTHVAGIAAAAGDNGEGVAGMCWQCRIMPIKVFNSDGEASDEWVANGIRYAVDHGARVINLSLGAFEESPIERDAVLYAFSKNVLIVAAAGNSFDEGNPVSYPAAYDEVLAVSATDENDQRAFFSEVHPYVDVAAPGWNVASTWNSGNPPIPYLSDTGTSMSSPYVAGLAGLLLSINPSLDINALKNIIMSSADDLGQPGMDWEFGAGRINAGRAVASVGNPAFDPAANPNQPDVSFFPETQHTLRGAFKQFWEQNGGLPVFGFPTSEEFTETTAEGAFVVQYFERNRFEFHPEKQPPYNVLLGRLSDVQLKSQGRDWFTFPKGEETPGCQFFAETGHSVCEPFLSYWKNNGLRDPNLSAYGRSLALFGLPLSQPQPELNSSGETVLTQWFERARFEFHPDKPQPYQVLLGLLGNETAKPGASTTPQSGQTPPDRCGPVPGPQNAQLRPGSCVLVGTLITVQAGGFQPGEDVVLSIVVEGQSIPSDIVQADPAGNIGVLGQVLLPPNVYGLVFQGTQSGNQAVVYVKTVDR